MVAGAFGCTGSALLVIQTADKMGLARVDIVSWLFSIYVLGGLLGVLLSLKYKMPISGAYTIAGTVLLLETNIIFSLNELVFAYLITGIIILLVGITGIKEKIMNIIPFEIIMAMVSGVLLKVTLGMMVDLPKEPTISLIVFISFIVFSKFNKKIPPILSSMIVGTLASFGLRKIGVGNESLDFILPRLVRPEINWQSIISISIPLAILILGSENAQAIGVLRSNGYNPPINDMTIKSGLAIIIASFFGGHAVNIAGPMTAICGGEAAGEKDKRYMASVLNGIIFIIFGLFSSITVYFVNVLPRALINSIAVLALMGVLSNSFKSAFSNDNLKNSVILTFLISMMDISLFNIGGAIWGLLVGTLIFYFNEKKGA